MKLVRKKAFGTICFEVRIPSKKAKKYYGFFLRKFSLVNDRRSKIVKNSNARCPQKMALLQFVCGMHEYFVTT